MKSAIGWKITKAFVVCGAVGLAGLGAKPVQADIITIDASNVGWYSDGGFNNVSLPDSNYAVGQEIFEGGQFRNYFSFDLSSLNLSPGQAITSAQLLLTPFEYLSPDPTETLSFFDVTTPTDALIALNSGAIEEAIYNDLGSGVSYGSSTVSDGLLDPAPFTLNMAAVEGINSSIPTGFFNIGGALTTISGGEDQYIFGGSSGGIKQLVITTGLAAEPTPEPGTWAMMGLGLAGLAFVQKRKKRSAVTTFA